MKPYLSFRDFCRLSWQLCLKCDLTPPRHRKLTALYFSPEPQPLLLEGIGARAWIDKYYMAFQVQGGPVEYIYISRRHIEEEKQALKEVRRQRGLYLSLPQEIERAFGEAEREMARTRSACVCRWT